MSDQSEMDTWVAQDSAPVTMAASPERKLLRLLRRVKLLDSRTDQLVTQVQSLKDRVTALENP